MVERASMLLMEQHVIVLMDSMVQHVKMIINSAHPIPVSMARHVQTLPMEQYAHA